MPDSVKRSPGRHGCQFVGGSLYIRCDWPSRSARLRPADCSRAGLYLDSGLLGVGSRWIFLGAWKLVPGTCTRLAVDAGILGLFHGSLLLAPGLLGTASRLLRRHQLRLWLSG